MLRCLKSHFRTKPSPRSVQKRRGSEAERERKKEESQHPEAESERSVAESERSEAESERLRTERYEDQPGCLKAMYERLEAELERYEAERQRHPDIPQEELCEAITTPPSEQPSDAAAISIQAELARQKADSEAVDAHPTTSVHYGYDSEPSRQSAQSKAPSVRITERCRLQPHTDNADSAIVDRCLPEGKTYLTLKASTFHLAAVGRTLVTPGPSRHTVVRLLNLSNRAVSIHAGTIIAVLLPAKRATRSSEYNKTDGGVWPKVNLTSIADVERGLLGCLLTQNRHLFANETGQIPFEDLKPPSAMDSEKLDLIANDPANDLLTYIAECRPARNTFPFRTDSCAVRCANAASWQLAMSHADSHVPRRFHATLHLPTEIRLPSTAPKARYISTLTPLHHNVSDALPFHELHRRVELCTPALNHPLLPPDYAQTATDLETHIRCAMAVYAPVILFGAQDVAAMWLNQFLEQIDKACVRLDTDRSFIADPTATLCGVTFEARRCYAAIRSRSLSVTPCAAIFDHVRVLWTPLPNRKCFIHIIIDQADEAYAVVYQEQHDLKPVAVLTSTIPSGHEQPWHHTAATAMRLLAPSFPANAAVTLCCPERHVQLQSPLNRIMHELKSTITPCIHRYL